MKLRPALLALAVLAAGLPAAAEVTLAAPASVGVAPASMQKLDAAMHALVDDGKLAGVTTLVARRGRVVHFDAYGKRDLESGAPVERDTIFRIASMTKPVTGVAMMMLYEEGRWKLDDPVSKFIPEFADLKVKTADGALVAQTRPMTMRELMSHTAGFDVSAGYAPEVTSRDITLQQMVERLAALPLAAQPGTDWRYGPSVNIQGHIVERLSGMTLDRFFETRIFAPLGMTDTAFWVETADAGRVARINTYVDGKLTVAPTPFAPTSKPTLLQGSGGLYSTTEDYWRFAQMLLDEGRGNGKRLLKPQTVRLMRTNVLPAGVVLDLYGPSQSGTGFGMDVAIVDDPAAAKSPLGKGTHYWGGAFGTWYWVDPVNELVFVGMIQNLRGSIPGAGTPDVRSLSAGLVYEALTPR